MNIREKSTQKAPPSFSALHVNGKRASDLAREGIAVELPPRPVSVFSAEIKETKNDSQGLVEYCRINFSVSKGTYIRCLARDIAKEAGSAGHLVGLYRTRVGNFDIKDAAGYSELSDFDIASSIEASKISIDLQKPHTDDSALQEEIRNKICGFDRSTAKLCGFDSITLKDDQAEKDYCNGKPLRSALFTTNLHDLAPSASYAVFSQTEIFRGLIEKESGGCIRHRFVINV